MARQPKGVGTKGLPPVDRQPWDRRERESARAYLTFRRFRDLGPLRKVEQLVDDDTRIETIRLWHMRHDWRDRTKAWDDELHRAEDAARLEAIRLMHDRHQRAGRAAMAKGLAALAKAEAEDIPPYAAARLVELGARLERETLTTSVEALQGIPPPAGEDPWEAVARELDGVPDI